MVACILKNSEVGSLVSHGAALLKEDILLYSWMIKTGSYNPLANWTFFKNN